VITLRPNQIAAADAVEDAYRIGMTRPLVDSCVGSGKSLTMAELARRAWLRGERTIILAHTRELVEQNAEACRKLGLQVGVNAASLGERTWRAPVISASIQSVYKSARSFGPVQNIFTDEAHLIPPSDNGMYREFRREFPSARFPGFSGTVYRLQGGSLVEGEAAQFEKVVYTYSIVDGIRDGYLVPAFTAPTYDAIDVSRLRVRQGEYTGESQDAQMIAQMDNHCAQLVQHRDTRRGWLLFEASVKAAKAMTERLNQWGIRAVMVVGEMSDAERTRNIQMFRSGQAQALVNKDVCTVGFDVQHVDLLAMRFKTKSLGKYVQIIGRLLRTIGGNIEASIAAGKADGILFDWGGNVDDHGPLDFLRPKLIGAKLVSCEACGKRNGSAAVKCWNCDEPIHKLCPGCLANIPKGTLDCPECRHDMRLGTVEGAAPRGAKLLETPSGAALIAAFRPVSEKAGGWIPIRKTYSKGEDMFALDNNGTEWALPSALSNHAIDARWIRGEGGAVAGLLKPNGASRTTVLQVTVGGAVLPVPMPPSAA
jgi:DNA repair protein RadD